MTDLWVRSDIIKITKNTIAKRETTCRIYERFDTNAVVLADIVFKAFNIVVSCSGVNLSIKVGLILD